MTRVKPGSPVGKFIIKERNNFKIPLNGVKVSLTNARTLCCGEAKAELR